jgi:hypothetical protein
MRTRVRDVERVVNVRTLMPIPSGVSGNGIFSDGTPWNMVRTATGEYTISFDSRLIPVSFFCVSAQGTRLFFFEEAMGPGSVRPQVLLHDGTAQDATFDLEINWFDKRT